MPDTPPTLTHFITGFSAGGPDVACSGGTGRGTNNVGSVTCFACRRTPEFLAEQGVGAATPVKLSGVMANSKDMQALAAGAREYNLTASRNHRGMYSVEESIHHGDYRSLRTVEVYDITTATIDGILMSSAYCYGSWQNPENPEHRTRRRTALARLVDDLRHGRTNRDIGWSTFRLV